MASTNGTVIPNILNFDYGEIVNFTCFITNKSQCFARKKIQDYGIKDYFISSRLNKKKDWEKKALKVITSHNIDLIVLVGFMKILSGDFIDSFKGDILNIHPSLLPKFAGMMNIELHEEVLKSGEKISGATVHEAVKEVDSGKIILQKSVNIEKCKTAEELKNTVQSVEKEIYPIAIYKKSKEIFIKINGL